MNKLASAFHSKRAIFTAILLLLTTAGHTVEPSLRPGGIAIVDVGNANAPRPVVRFNDKPVLLMQGKKRWRAIVGIPLSQPVGPAPITVDGELRQFEIEHHAYREQRLTVKNQDYVSPQQAQLDRIAAERRIIDSAINHFRDVPLDAVALATPVDGKRSSSFGSRRFFNEQPRAPHSGMDIAAATGVRVLAPKAAVVAATGDFFFNGSTVLLDHGQGFVTLYCHLSEIAVAPGQALTEGQDIGAVGATGRVTGAHLHFGTYLNGAAIDPAIFLAIAD